MNTTITNQRREILHVRLDDIACHGDGRSTRGTVYWHLGWPAMARMLPGHLLDDASFDLAEAK